MAREAFRLCPDAVNRACNPETETSYVGPKFCDARQNVPIPPLPLPISLTYYLDERVVSVPSASITRSGHSPRITACADDILVMRKYYQST